jgi:Fe-S-cluster containining protein
VIKDPEIIARESAARTPGHWRFDAFLRMARLPAARVDALATRLGREAEAQMNCRSCAACCRDNWIPLSDDEVLRLARCRGLEIEAFRSRYLAREGDSAWVIDARPCPFLDHGTCSVYDHRPEACRGYPYIEGNVRSRMPDIIERAGVCPITFEMLEQLKQKLGFGSYRDRTGPDLAPSGEHVA